MSREISASAQPAFTAGAAVPEHPSCSWDPEQYGRFGDERGRAFHELAGRVRCDDPRQVADLGCGSGGLTMELARRWPRARIIGIDGSAEMIEAARRLTITPPRPGTGPEFEVGDVAAWQPDGPVDVITANAVLHWIPSHRELLARWVRTLVPGGWIAFQVPGNFDAPSHATLRDLCGSPRWRETLADVAPGRPVDDALGYFDRLSGLGCRVDAWETTYTQVLHGDDPVLEWMKGTALRPVLGRLQEASGSLDAPLHGPAADFLAEYAERLRAAYPRTSYGTVFPFRRVFVVARTPGADERDSSGSSRSRSERLA